MGIDPVSNVATAANGIVGALTGLIEKFIPDKEKAAEAAQAIQAEMLKQQGEENAGQIEINKVEAGSPSLFVSGWRPAIGWVCAAGYTWAAVLQPIVTLIMAAANKDFHAPPIQSEILESTLFGMLGLGAMHSFDKYQGTAPPSATVVTTKEVHKATAVK